jgi:hypothetical protein
VGRPELQRLFGARGRALDKDLLFFTGSSYAATAIGYATENGIALFVYGLDGAMTAVNASARRIATAPASTHSISLAQSAPATPAPVLTSAPTPRTAKAVRPGTGRIVLGLVLMAVALLIPGGDSFEPRPSQALVTLLLAVVPTVLIVSGIREKSRRRYWPTGLGLLLVDLPAAWLTNARLWQGDTADILVPATFTVLSLTAAVLLLRLNTRKHG